MNNKDMYLTVDAVMEGLLGTESLQPILDYFKSRSEINVGRLVTDGVETRKLVMVYEKTYITSEFHKPEFNTKIVWALGPAVSTEGMRGNYILMDCDPIKWSFV